MPEAPEPVLPPGSLQFSRESLPSLTAINKYGLELLEVYMNGFGLRHLPILFAALLSVLALSSPIHAQLPTTASTGNKARLAIRDIKPTASVTANAATHGQTDALNQIVDACDSQLLNAIEQTRKFEIVARADLKEILKEQDLETLGLGGSADSQGARAFELLGAGYVLTVTIDNFQDVVTRAVLEGQLGSDVAERREIQIQAVVKIFDSSKGTLVRSSSQSFTTKQVSQVPTGQQREGRATNQVLGDVAKLVSSYAANDLTDFVFPPKVMAMTFGVLTFNRTKESGVSVGQWWEAFALGAAMTDPDTGESLGAEEIHIGWAKVTDAGAKFSKAQVFADNGVDCGMILRKSEAAPENAGQLEKSTPDCVKSSDGFQPAPQQPAPVRAAPPVLASPALAAPEPAAPSAPAVATIPAESVATTEKPLRMAIFIKNRAKGIDDAMVMVLEDAMIAHSTSSELEIIPREDVVNAVSRFASKGANTGTGDAKALDVEKALSDETSAANLSANMGADAVLIGSIVSLTNSKKRLQDADLGIDRTVHEQKLTTNYRILDGGTGGALASGDIVVSSKWQTGGNLQQDAPPIEDLLRESGIKLSEKMRTVVFSGGMRAPTAAIEMTVAVITSIVDLAIPQITMEDGNAVISSGSYRLQPTAVNLYIDGVLVGQAPGDFQIRAGLHRIKCTRPLFEPFEAMLSVRAGQSLNIPMKLTEAGAAQIKENAKFFQDMKERQALTAAQVKVAEGYAEFLKNSSIKIDTSSLEKLEVGNDFWGKLFR